MTDSANPQGASDYDREMARQRVAAQAKAIEMSGIPRRAFSFASATPRETKALAAVRTDGLELLALAGPAGCGKTVAACWWLLQARSVGLFVSAAALSRWSRYDETQMARLLRAERLVLDDLGTEFLDEKGSYLATLDEVLVTRYDNVRPTVLTTNITEPEAFRRRYQERICDRISERQGFVVLDGASMRRAA